MHPKLTIFIGTVAVLVLLAFQGHFLLRIQQIANDNESLRAQVDQLEAEIDSVSRDSHKTIRSHLELQLPGFIKRAEGRLTDITFDIVKARRLVILDDRNVEKIIFGARTLEDTGIPGTSIILRSPQSGNEIVFSATDEAASVGVNRRVILKSESEAGLSGLLLYAEPYTKGQGMRPLLKAVANHEASQLVLSDRAGQTRAALAVKPDSSVVSLFYNRDGELVYGLLANDNSYVDTFLKASPTAQAWSDAGKLGTIATFLDLLLRR